MTYILFTPWESNFMLFDYFHRVKTHNCYRSSWIQMNDISKNNNFLNLLIYMRMVMLQPLTIMAGSCSFRTYFSCVYGMMTVSVCLCVCACVSEHTQNLLECRTVKITQKLKNYYFFATLINGQRFKLFRNFRNFRNNECDGCGWADEILLIHKNKIVPTRILVGPPKANPNHSANWQIYRKQWHASIFKHKKIYNEIH